MFKRILLCYDGSEAGRTALKQGAELAVFVKAEVHLLSVLQAGAADPVMVAAAAGHACVVDDIGLSQRMLAESVERLRARGVLAHGHITRGDTIDEIVAYAKSLRVDLIVVGHYPRVDGRWWAGSKKAALAERVNCSVFIAVSDASLPSGIKPVTDAA
jgi:nucleotide-binding universal stress UspA family protein